MELFRLLQRRRSPDAAKKDEENRQENRHPLDDLPRTERDEKDIVPEPREPEPVPREADPLPTVPDQPTVPDDVPAPPTGEPPLDQGSFLRRRWMSAPRMTAERMPVELASLDWKAAEVSQLFDEIERDQVELRYALALHERETAVALDDDPEPVHFAQLLSALESGLPERAFCRRMEFLFRRRDGALRQRRGVLICPDEREPMGFVVLFQRRERAVAVRMLRVFVPLVKHASMRAKVAEALALSGRWDGVEASVARLVEACLPGLLSGDTEREESDD